MTYLEPVPVRLPLNIWTLTSGQRIPVEERPLLARTSKDRVLVFPNRKGKDVRLFSPQDINSKLPPAGYWNGNLWVHRDERDRRIKVENNPRAETDRLDLTVEEVGQLTGEEWLSWQTKALTLPLGQGIEVGVGGEKLLIKRNIGGEVVLGHGEKLYRMITAPQKKGELRVAWLCVGRAGNPEEDVVLEDPKVSERHLTLYLLEHQRRQVLLMVDHSTNGTSIRPVRLAPKPAPDQAAVSAEGAKMASNFKLTSGEGTDPGQVRELNEDYFGTPETEGVLVDLVEQKGRLYAVADGMGGHAAGEVASQGTVRALFKEYYASPSAEIVERMKEAIEVANAEIHVQASLDRAKVGMGTTLVAAVLQGDDLYVANAGDSRAYLVRERSIEQVTTDHSWVNELVQLGKITEAEAWEHLYRNVVTRSIGNKPEVEIDFFQRKVQAGDALVLCCDGLSNEVKDDEIARIVSANNPQTATQELINLANQRGGPDNITAVVVKIEEKRA